MVDTRLCMGAFHFLGNTALRESMTRRGQKFALSLK